MTSFRPAVVQSMRALRGVGPTRQRQDDAKATLVRMWRDVAAARRALARSRASAIAHTARGLLTTLGSVRVQVELAHAASAFADGLDERAGSEEWVLFAVAARATLEHAVRVGASELVADLVELDESFADLREAVLLLEPEDYKEALAGTPPNTRVWWGERARLDGGVREIDLERALSALATR
jgi:hypothetical protein